MAGFDLGKQVGPLPMGAWLGVIGGGLAIAYFINKRQAAGDAAVATLDPNSDVGVGGGQLIESPPTTVTPDTPELEKTNQSWGIQAENFLIAASINPTDAHNTVAKFLSSMPLTPQEKAMMNMVLIRYGAPPEPLAPTDDVPVVTPPVGGGTPSTGSTPHPISKIWYTRAVNRNDIRWQHDNVNVTHFQVRAVNKNSGRVEQVWTVLKHPGNGLYGKAHIGSTAWTWKSRPHYLYTVQPFNGTKGGAVAKIGDAIFIPAK